jgi:sugar phosphate isomerase/epimerase
MKWRLGVATGACTDRPILDVIDTLPNPEIVGVEIGTPPRHFTPFVPAQVEAVRERMRHRALRAVSIHAPFGGLLDLADPNPRHRHAAIGAIITAASAIKRLGGHVVVVHPSDIQRHGADVDARLADSRASLRVLAASLAVEDLLLAVETPLPHLIGGHPDEFACLLASLPATAGVCIDTGHVALGRHWRRFMDVAGHRIVHVHAHDNHGHRDDHLPPGDGCIDWREIAGSLDAVGYRGWIMLELGCPDGDFAPYVRRAVRQAREVLGIDAACA